MTGLAATRPTNGMPKGVLIAAAVLIAIVISGAWFARVSGYGRFAMPDAQPVQGLALHFDDQSDGSVVVRRAGDFAVIYRIAPETNGFIRQTLRGLVRDRRSSGPRGLGPVRPDLLGRRPPYARRLDHWPARGARILRRDQRRRFRATFPGLGSGSMSFFPAMRSRAFETSCVGARPCEDDGPSRRGPAGGPGQSDGRGCDVPLRRPVPRDRRALVELDGTDPAAGQPGPADLRPEHGRRDDVSGAGALARRRDGGGDHGSVGVRRFACGLLVWGWQLLGFYTGFVAGPNRTPCAPGSSALSRFAQAVGATSITSSLRSRAALRCSS